MARAAQTSEYKSDACPAPVAGCTINESYKLAFFPCSDSGKLDRAHDCLLGRLIAKIGLLSRGERADAGHDHAINVAFTYYLNCLASEGYTETILKAEIVNEIIGLRTGHIADDATRVAEQVRIRPAIEALVSPIRSVIIPALISAGCLAGLAVEEAKMDAELKAYKQTAGGSRRSCKLCGAQGVNSLSCPRNPQAKHPKPRQHS